MMATIIELGNDTFIAGDPPSTLLDGHHWCSSCSGSGLEDYYDQGLGICLSCNGLGQEPCVGTADCGDCADAHLKLRLARLSRLADICSAASKRALAAAEHAEADRCLLRQGAVVDALITLARSS